MWLSEMLPLLINRSRGHTKNYELLAADATLRVCAQWRSLQSISSCSIHLVLLVLFQSRGGITISAEYEISLHGMTGPSQVN
jgi:hypothetical protein